MSTSEGVRQLNLPDFLHEVEGRLAHLRDKSETIDYKGLYGRPIIDRLVGETGLREDELKKLLSAFGISTRTRIPMSELFVFSEIGKPTGFFAFQQPIGEFSTIEKATGTIASYYEKDDSQVIKIAGINNKRIYAASYIKQPQGDSYELTDLDVGIDQFEERQIMSRLGRLDLIKTPLPTADQRHGFVSRQMVKQTGKEWRYSFRNPPGDNSDLLISALNHLNGKIGASFIPPLFLKTGVK